ncbi:MAG: hypothetical protein PHS14_03810 [Elusimicrobia bacterium]|nr:hypothetical protein [Elusimicrobiota bacterium]
MITSAFVLLLATAGSAKAGPAPSPIAAASAVAASTGAAHLPIGASTQTVSSIYTGDRVRDPFLPAAMGGARSRRTEDAKTEGPEVVDIHGMMLRGIMKDPKIDYALFTSEGGGSYLLRGGRLYNERNKPVPGITGAIKLKQKTVELITSDKDVQVFRLGEDEKDKEKP